MDKATRQELRRRCPTPEETDALLDMADERDRYRALLVDIYHDKWTDPYLMERIKRALGTEHPRHDAALEGKTND